LDTFINNALAVAVYPYKTTTCGVSQGCYPAEHSATSSVIVYIQTLFRTQALCNTLCYWSQHGQSYWPF